MPVTDGLPLLTLDAGRDDQAHFGAFVYVVGMVDRFDPQQVSDGSPVQNGDFEVVGEDDFQAWVADVQGEQAPEPPARPRRLS